MVHPLANIAGDLQMGENCRIDPYVTITGRVRLGNNVHLGVGACLFGSEGIEIGDDCSVSPGARIFTGTFDADTGYRANPQVCDKSYIVGPVHIGNRCIVGSGSVVLPGVTLADDVLIGALSLVKADLKAGLYAGTPARKISSRNDRTVDYHPV